MAAIASVHLVAAAAAPQTLTFHLDLFDKAKVTTQFTSSDGKVYLGTYRFVINTMNESLIGNENAVTTSPDTWTDYIQLDANGWSRNHRIAPPISLQPQQWTGMTPMTSGTVSPGKNSFTLVLRLPDPYLGSNPIFNLSVITYISPLDSPGDLHPVDALGPRLSSHTSIDFMFFDPGTGNPNVLRDSVTKDWRTYPHEFPDLKMEDYRNFGLDTLILFTQ